MKRVLVADPDADVRSLIQTTLRKLGYEPVCPSASLSGPPPQVDAVVLEPSGPYGHAVLRRFGEDAPPVICFSIYPPEAGLAPSGSVAYLVKPSSCDELGEALRDLFAA